MIVNGQTEFSGKQKTRALKVAGQLAQLANLSKNN